VSNVWLLDSGWVQMNVLHLHLSDYCRFAVESRVFPELTAGLESGEQAGFYTQDQVTVVTRWKRRDER
jgi:N-acetyl-beta-hexosaminidase